LSITVNREYICIKTDIEEFLQNLSFEDGKGKDTVGPRTGHKGPEG
jgi:hypothetical protein